jgi:hypothetical protein
MHFGIGDSVSAVARGVFNILRLEYPTSLGALAQG